MYEPIPDPVPPAIEWHNTKPSKLSLPSACSIMLKRPILNIIEHETDLTINHVHDILDMILALTVSAGPIVACSSTLGVYDKVFWIVQLFVVTGFNAIDNSIFKV
jgi:hypothetical protein